MAHGNRLEVIPIVLLIIISEAIAQTSLQYFHRTNNLLYFITGIFGYVLVSVFLVVAYRRTQMGVTNSVWSALSIISMIIIGMVIFKERIPVHDLVGIFFIFIGVCILFFYDLGK
jgi:small multidrug resistance pump